MASTGQGRIALAGDGRGVRTGATDDGRVPLHVVLLRPRRAAHEEDEEGLLPQPQLRCRVIAPPIHLAATTHDEAETPRTLLNRAIRMCALLTWRDLHSIFEFNYFHSRNWKYYAKDINY